MAKAMAAHPGAVLGPEDEDGAVWSKRLGSVSPKPFWDPIVGIGEFTTHFRTHFGTYWDVYWGYDLDFDPWPFGGGLKTSGGYLKWLA